MKRAFVEKLKNVLIAVLIATAVLLALETGVFHEIADGFRTVATIGEPVAGDDYAAPTEAARPAAIAVRLDTGVRAVAKFDTAAVDSLYERTVSIMGEALSTAATPRPTTEAEWRAALTSSNIMYEYFAEAPLALVGRWLGADIAGELPVLRVCLVLGDDSALFFSGGDAFYRSATASLGGTVTVTTDYHDERVYQFEFDAQSAAPYHILFNDSRHPTALVTNPLERSGALSTILAGFGIDDAQRPGYTESDGTQVYVTGSFTLSVSPVGVLNYRRNAVAESGGDIAPMVSDVEQARTLAQRVLGAGSGDARLWFSGVSTTVDGQGSVVRTVTFDYYLAGGRVFLQEAENAATVTVADGVVTEMTLHFYSFATEGEVLLLPEKQAIAAANGEMLLGYSDAATSVPFWYATEGDD